MKSQVGLGRLYPDGRLDHAHDTPTESAGETPNEETPASTELVPVVVHVEKSALNELLEKAAQS